MAGHAKSESDERSIVGDSARTAVGGLVFCLILYLIELKFPVLSVLNINLQDLQMIAVCIVLFAVFWPAFSAILLRPYLKLFSLREKMTVGAEAYIQAQETHAHEINDKYETRLSDVRVAAIKEKMALISKAKIEAAKLVEKAQSEAQLILQNSRKASDADLKQLELRLSEEAQALSRSMIEKIAPREITSQRGFSRLSICLLLVVLGVMFHFPSLTFAASSGHGEGHVPSIWDLKYFFLNFSLYCLFVIFLVRKFGLPAWASRRSRIQHAIQESQNKISRSENKVVEARARLTRVEQDAEALTRTIAVETEREIEMIQLNSQRTAERVLEQAKVTAQIESKAQMRALQRRLIENALRMAESDLRLKLDAVSDRLLRKRVEAKLSELTN